MLRPNLLVASLLVLAGCIFGACSTATYHMAPLPDQSVALTSPDLSRIYVLRTAQTRGNLRRVRVFDGEMEIGSISQTEYVCWERLPGRSLVTVAYEGPKADGGNTESLLDLVTEPGGIYHYGISIDKRGNKPVIELLGPAEARELLVHRRPSQTL